jgi:hypothetical protein
VASYVLEQFIAIPSSSREEVQGDAETAYVGDLSFDAKDLPVLPPKLIASQSTPTPYRTITSGSSGSGSSGTPLYATTAAMLSAHLGASDRALYSEPEASDVLLGDGYSAHIRRATATGVTGPSSSTVTNTSVPYHPHHHHTPALPPSTMSSIDTHAPLLAAALGDAMDIPQTPILPRSASIARMGLNPRSFTPSSSKMTFGETKTSANNNRDRRASSSGYESNDDLDYDIEPESRPGKPSSEPRQVKLAPGQRLFLAGAEANFVYVVIEGKLHAYKDDDEVLLSPFLFISE